MGKLFARDHRTERVLFWLVLGIIAVILLVINGHDARATWCYQEDPLNLTHCSQTTVGAKGSEIVAPSSWNSLDNIWDYSYATSGYVQTSGGQAIAYMNYTKTYGANASTLWEYKDGAGTGNLSLASCFSAYDTNLMLRVISNAIGTLDARWECYNTTDWVRLRTTANGASNRYVYEESVWWAISDDQTPVMTNRTETPITPATYTTFYVLNSTWVDFTGIDVVKLTFNSTVYVGTNITLGNLSAGTYYYNWTANDTVGNTNTSATFTYTVLPSTSSLALSTSSTSSTYGTAVTTNCTQVAGDNGATLTLYRNGTSINTSTTGTIMRTDILAVGSYNHTCTYTASQNYTTTSNSTYFTVNKATSTLSLSAVAPDGSDIAKTNENITINASLTSGTGTINLYINDILNTTGEDRIDLSINFNTAGIRTLKATYTGNENYTAATDVTDLISIINVGGGGSDGGIVGGGGGGGTDPDTIIITIGDTNFTIKTERGGTSYNAYINPGGTRDFPIVIKNTGLVKGTITLDCTSTTDHCKYVTLTNTTATLDPKQSTTITATITIPQDTAEDTLAFNIRVKETNTNFPFELTVSPLGAVFTIFGKLSQPLTTIRSPTTGGTDLPIPAYILTLTIIASGAIGGSMVAKTIKKPRTRSLTVVATFIISIVLGVLIPASIVP